MLTRVPKKSLVTHLSPRACWKVEKQSCVFDCMSPQATVADRIVSLLLLSLSSCCYRSFNFSCDILLIRRKVLHRRIFAQFVQSLEDGAGWRPAARAEVVFIPTAVSFYGHRIGRNLFRGLLVILEVFFVRLDFSGSGSRGGVIFCHR